MKALLQNKERLLKLLIGTYLTLAIILVGYSFLHGTYHVVEEDETIYYNAARCFAETSSARATDCLNEQVSKIGQYNWYGPLYNILYGSILKVICMPNYLFLIINIFCLGLILVLLLRTKFTYETKLLLLATFLALNSVIGYVFTFFPETLELLFAVILSLQLNNLFTNAENTNKKTWQYVLLTLFFALFRITTVFWAFAILASSKSLADFAKKLGISLACFLLIYLYLSYFDAPFAGGSITYIMSHKLGLGAISYLSKKTLINVYAFLTRNPFYDMLQIPILFIALYSYFVSKNRYMLAACIVSVIYYCVLLTLYGPYSYFFNKQVACLYPLLLIALYTTDTSKFKYLAALLLILFSPLTYIKAGRAVMLHKQADIERRKNENNTRQLNIIGIKTVQSKPVTILTVYRDFDTIMPFSIFATSLPVSTANKEPILYNSCMPISEPSDITFKNEANFQFYHKIHIDYILSRLPLTIDSTSLTYSCNLFYLYRNNRQVK